jgi:hypothetical protein
MAASTLGGRRLAKARVLGGNIGADLAEIARDRAARGEQRHAHQARGAPQPPASGRWSVRDVASMRDVVHRITR